MFTIRQTSAGWELLDADGNVVGKPHESYQHALVALGGLLGGLAELAAADPIYQAATEAGSPPPGCLPVRWRSGPNGEALQTATGPQRDFSNCTYFYRPGPLPLMFKDTSSHGGFDDGPAKLAGFSDVAEIRDGVPHSGGWMLDNEAGRALAQVLDAQGQYGVSVDPGENIVADFVCTEFDDDGWCIAETVEFSEYEIAGRTAVMFPGFQDAWIEWDRPEGAAAPAPAIAAAGGYREPSPAYLTAEPPALDDGRWVTQRATGLPAIPLDISEPDPDGWRHVSGFAGAAGVCHIGIRDQCVTIPESPTGYANFHLFVQQDAEGGRHHVGRLVYGRDHVELAGVDLRTARDNYANTNLAWANVRAVDYYAPEGAVWNGEPIGGTFLGVWLTGVVLRHVSPEAVAVLRAGGVSGDWREEQVDNRLGALDMVGCQSVNVPGFPVTRQAVAAAGGVELAEYALRVRRVGSRVVAAQGIGVVERSDAQIDALAASGTVRCAACPEPTGIPGSVVGRREARRSARAVNRATAVGLSAADRALLVELIAISRQQGETIAALEQRTRHLRSAEREARAAAFGRHPTAH